MDKEAMDRPDAKGAFGSLSILTSLAYTMKVDFAALRAWLLQVGRLCALPLAGIVVLVVLLYREHHSQGRMLAYSVSVVLLQIHMICSAWEHKTAVHERRVRRAAKTV